MNRDVMFSSASEEWETPQEYFNWWDVRYRFSVDAAASDQNHKCPRYYTREQDGLAQDWGGETVWCNPPYGRQIGKWVEKAYHESKKPGTVVVMLLPARTDTKWFHGYVLGKAKIEFVQGRLKFGGSQNSAPFPSMVAIFGGKNYAEHT